MKRLLFSVALFLSLASQSSAYRMTVNQRLDRAIYAGHDPKLIVAGKIVKKDVEPLDSVTGPANKVSFEFKIATVILGRQQILPSGSSGARTVVLFRVIRTTSCSGTTSFFLSGGVGKMTSRRRHTCRYSAWWRSASGCLKGIAGSTV